MDFEWGQSAARALKLKNGDVIELQKLEIEKDCTDLTKWDALFTLLDEKYNELYAKNPKSIDKDFKLLVADCFSRFLQKFPYLKRYWSLWQIFEFKLNGIEKSLEVLSKSVRSFPTSIELWVEYLTALTTQIDSKTHAKSSSQEEFIRLQYNQAIKYNGYHYNSHPLWDKIIHFENLINPNSEILLNIYLKLLTIPLYQYSQYYKQFGEINKKFDVNKVIPSDILKDYVSKFNKKRTQELSMIERHQIIDDYCDKVTAVTQQKVLAKWNYESSITSPDFSFELLKINPDYSKWIEYINFELEALKKSETDVELVKSVFERALVPNCFNSDLWLKYFAFLSTLDLEKIVENTKLLYLRAILIIPLLETKVRFSYVKFLLSNENHTEALEYLTGFISDIKNPPVYLKKQFLDSLKLILNILFTKLKPEIFERLLLLLIQRYFDKGKKSEKFEIPKTKIHDDLKIYVTLLPKYTNSDSIDLVIMLYLRCIVSINRDDEVLQVRKFYNQYSQETVLQSSTSFWAFYVEYEGMIHYNMTNLNAIIHHIKTKTTLPQITIESFIDLANDIYLANLKQTFDAGNQIIDSVLYKDNDVSKSFTHNENLKKRLANNLIAKEAKSLKSVNNTEDVLKLVRKHALHPGVPMHSSPDITNKCSSKDNWTSILENNVTVPPLPLFQNVEKAALPVSFPNE